MDKYHVHVVDGAGERSKAGASAVSAAALFAHLALRCGNLASCVCVSASTAAATASLSPSASLVEEAAESDDTATLQQAVRALKGEPSTLAEAGAVRPYPYLSSSFAVVEESLSRAVHMEGHARYFDLIVAADMATYDYVLDYYQAKRRHGAELEGSPLVVHITCAELSRACLLVQQFLASVLLPDGAAGEGEQEDGNGDAWLDHVDETTRRFSLLYGVDVLVMVV